MALVSIAAAATSAQDPGCVPRSSASQGFRLVVNVTDPAKDLNPPVHGQFVSTAHIGPAQNRAIVTPSAGPVFYQNGTYEDITMQRIAILTDGGTPPFPEGLIYQQEQDDSKGNGIYIVAGDGGHGTRLTRLAEPYSYLTILADVVRSTFVACGNTVIPAIGDKQKFTVVNWVQAMRGAGGSTVVVPDGCVAVNLVPQCATLNALPADAQSSHEFAQEVRCYDNVTAID